MSRILILLILSTLLSACPNKSKNPEPATTTSSSSDWTSSQIDEVKNWYFESVISKAQSFSGRGDNAKKEFAKCWTLKMAKEYSYPEYKKAWKDMDDYIRTNNIVIRTLEDNTNLSQKFPFNQRMGDFLLECGNELKI